MKKRKPKKDDKKKKTIKKSTENNYKYNVHLRKKLKIVMKRFKFKELEISFPSAFPEIEWDDIKFELIQRRESFSSVNVYKYIENFIKDNSIQDRDLREKLSILETIDVSRHSQMKIWYGYKLESLESEVLRTCDLQKNMLKYFNTYKMNMNVKILIENGITFVSINNMQSVNSLSVNFALFIDLGYFFCSKKEVSKEFIESIVKGCGYRACKSLKLNGRDLNSLIKLVLNKKQGAIHSDQLVNSLVYYDANPTYTETGIDFRQNIQRKNFIEKCFGDDDILLECLQVTNSSLPVKYNNISIKLKDTKVNSQWIFKSPNIRNYLTKLCVSRVLINPLPNYIKKLMMSGKNQLEIKTVEKNH